MVALAIVFLVLFFLTVDFFYQRWSIQREAARTPASAGKAVHLPLVEHIPHGTFVAPGHTWLTLDHAGNEVTVGADPIATGLLGEIDSLELKGAGARVERGEVIATIKRGARTIELRSAIEGVIEAVNARTEQDPDMLRRDPFGDGWLYRIRAEGLAGQLKDTKIGEEAALYLARELGRLRDAIAKVSGAQGVGATLADGGPIAEGAMVTVDDASFAKVVAEIFDPRSSAAVH